MLGAMLPVDLQSFVEGSSLRTGVYLHEPTRPSSELAKSLGVDTCEGSKSMNISGLQVHAGDIIFCRGSHDFGVFKVLGCAAAVDRPPLAIGLKHSRIDGCTWRLQAGDNAAVISHEDILVARV